MNRYKLVSEIGDGGFGTVYLAIHSLTGHKVAIKKMKKKFTSWDEAVHLPEVQSLKKLVHPNIIRLREVIRENLILYFVFEYLEENLFQVLKSRKSQNGFKEHEIRWIMFQLVLGLAYMHKSGYFHRDLKLENVLVAKGLMTKLADFGLARELRSRPPYTEYISTRWYRAPEVVLGAHNYSSPIDIWAAACIMAELYLLAPIFPGDSEIDQLFKIANVLGSPVNWNTGAKLLAARNFRLPTSLVPVELRSLIPNASPDAIDLMTSMLMYDPAKRPSAASILNHKFFMNVLEFRNLKLNSDFWIVSGNVSLNGHWLNAAQVNTNNPPIPSNHHLSETNVGTPSISSAMNARFATPPIPGVFGTAKPLYYRPNHHPQLTATTQPERQPSNSELDELLADLDSLTNDVPQYFDPSVCDSPPRGTRGEDPWRQSGSLPTPPMSSFSNLNASSSPPPDPNLMHAGTRNRSRSPAPPRVAKSYHLPPLHASTASSSVPVTEPLFLTSNTTTKLNNPAFQNPSKQEPQAYWCCCRCSFEYSKVLDQVDCGQSVTYLTLYPNLDVSF